MLPSFRPPFAKNPVLLRSTTRPVTPFGGMVSLVEFFSKIGLAAKLQEHMPFVHASSNSIPPAHTLMAFLCSVVAGASRFAHSDWLRSDNALHAMLGMKRFPSTDTVRNLFLRFTQGTIQTFWRPFGSGCSLSIPHKRKGSVWIWIPPFFNAVVSKRVLQKATIRAAPDAKRIIPFWRYWERRTACFMPGCAAAILGQAVE